MNIDLCRGILVGLWIAWTIFEFVPRKRGR